MSLICFAYVIFLHYNLYFFNSKLAALIIAFLTLLLISANFSVVRFETVQENYNFINYVIVFHIASFYVNKSVVTSFLIGISLFLSSVAIHQVFFLKQQASSTMVNPNILAGFLIMAIPLFMKNIFRSRISFFRLAALLFSMVAVLLTGSVSAIFGLVVSFVAIFMKKIKFAVIACLLLCAVIAKISDPQIINRLLWWQANLKVFLESPLLGVGLGGFKYLFCKYRTTEISSLFSHNYYLQLISEIGLISFCLIFVAVVFCFKHITDGYFKVAVMASLINNFFDYNLFLPSNALLFWTILGCGYKESNPIKLNPKLRLLLIALIIYYVFSVIVDYFSVNNFNLACIAKDRAKTEDYLEKSIKLNKSNWMSYEMLGDIHLHNYLKTKQQEYLIQAQHYYERAIHYNKAAFRVYKKLYTVHKKSGKIDNAEKYLKYIVEFEKYNPSLHY